MLDIDSSAHAVFVCKGDEKSILPFTHTEFSLIAHMSAAPRRAYSRSELIDACLPEGEALERTIDTASYKHLRSHDTGRNSVSRPLL